MISFLVPFRGDAWRRQLWDFIRARLEREHPDAEIVEAGDDGQDPFCKSMAVNRAAARASGDLFWIWDSDCWCPPQNVHTAVQLIQDGRSAWARPWRRKAKLGEAETRRILSLPAWDGTWDRRAPRERLNAFWAAPPLVLHREVFEDVGGMDERFRGWGGEDIAFARSLWKCGHGFAGVVPADCIHLWHPRIGTVGHDLWPGQAVSSVNDRLVQEYDRARTPEQMRELIARR